MGDLIITGLDDAVIQDLEAKARRRGMTLEAYLREMAAEAARPADGDDWIAEIDAIVEGQLRRPAANDSVALIAEGRRELDEKWTWFSTPRSR